MLRNRIFLIFVFSTLVGLAQESRRDSLANILKEHEAHDTTRVTLLREYASSIIINDSVYIELKAIADEILAISEEINYNEGRLFGNLTEARYYEMIGQNEKALEKFRFANNMAKALDRQVFKFVALRHIALFYERNSERDSSLLYLKRAYKIVKDQHSNETAEVLRQIAMAFHNRGLFDSAIFYADKALKLIEKENILDGARSAANILATSLKRMGEIDSALYYFNVALKYAKYEGDKITMLSVYNNMANIYGDRGNYPMALDYYLLTLKAAEEAGYDLAMAVTYNNIAIVYYTLKDYTETIQYLKRSLAISRKTEDIVNMVNTLNNLGEIYLKIDSIATALKLYNEAESLMKDVEDISYAVHNSRGKAIVYEKLNEKDSAFYYHKRALKYARQIGSKYELVEGNTGIARYYLNEKQYQKALIHAKKAFDYASKLGLIESIRNAADILHQANAKMARLKDAYNFLKIYTEMNDTLLNQDNTREVTQLEMQYKHDKEMQVLEAQEAIRELEQQKELTKQKGLRNAFIVAFILVLFIIILLIRNSKQKQKANQLLAFQKAEIEEKNEELQQLMSEVSRQKDEIELSHNQIKGSIRYAERIQNALLPLEEDLKELFIDHFVFYKPLEIVSGDFYWVEKVHNNILIAAGDCTGHGVPGAMLSMLGISYLNDIARQPNIVVASQVLEMLRKRVKRSLHQTGDVREARDGMDIAFAAINIEEQTLDYAGANNPIIIFRRGEMIELEPDKQPISVYQKEEPFGNQVIKLEKDDAVYFFTDGYIDQFNGRTNKKYGSKQFKDLLSKIHHQPMLNQKNILRRELDEWMKGTSNQIDDILVAGFKWK